MKIAFVFVNLFATVALAETTINLRPGSEITVNAGDRAVVRCEGQSSSGDKQCVVARNGETNRFGDKCQTSFSDYYCGYVYEFGAQTEFVNSFSSANRAVEWCKAQLK